MIVMVTETAAPNYWALMDQLGDTPFMPEGREQPEVPENRFIFDL